METEIECTECGWQGYVSELHCSDDDAMSTKTVHKIKFNLCPDCGEPDCFEDYED